MQLRATPPQRRLPDPRPRRPRLHAPPPRIAWARNLLKPGPEDGQFPPPGRAWSEPLARRPPARLSRRSGPTRARVPDQERARLAPIGSSGARGAAVAVVDRPVGRRRMTQLRFAPEGLAKAGEPQSGAGQVRRSHGGGGQL